MQHVGRVVVKLDPGNTVNRLRSRLGKGKHVAEDVGVAYELALVDLERYVFYEEDDIAVGEPEVCGLEVL